MRRFSIVIAICSTLFLYKTAQAQANIKLDEDSILFNVSPDVQEELRELWPTPQNIKWSRQVYREIFFNDSTTMNRSNSLLKFPDEPVTSYVNEGGVNKLTTKQNLFWLIFKLAIKHKVPIYQSNDYLTFTENDRIMNDSLLLSNLKYITEGKGKFVVKDVYTRSLNSTIIGYLIKENYYFDAEVSELRSQVVALAPLIESTTMGGSRDYTIPFWVTYESIIPWLVNYSMMASVNNNADVISFDTYFRKRLFKGNIIKIENPLNYTIAKECSECCADNIQDCLKKKQSEVENQISDFDQKQLWAQPFVDQKKAKKKSNASPAKQEKVKKAKTSPKLVDEEAVSEPVVSKPVADSTIVEKPIKKQKPVKEVKKAKGKKKPSIAEEEAPTTSQQ
ncbi:MAG: gliding motility protein GldN [Bacteroidales bacterium]